MPFPDELLELTAEAAFGADLTADPSTWSFTALTCAHPLYAAQTISRLTNDLISIKKGVAVGGSTKQTTSATLRALNADGYLTPEHPGSPYWPYVDVGTPMRLRLRTTTATLFTDTFSRSVGSGLGTSDSGYTYSYVGGSVNFSAGGSTANLNLLAANDLKYAVSQYSTRDIDATLDFSLPAVATGGTVTVGIQARWQGVSDYLWCAAGMLTTGQVQLVLYQVVGGVTTVAASTAVSVATYTSGTTIRLRAQVVSDRVRMRAWAIPGTEPTGPWQLDVRQTAIAAAGRVGAEFWAQPGNSNTKPFAVTFDNLTVTQPPYDRLEGYIADVRPTYTSDGAATWSEVYIDVGGVGVLTEKLEAVDESPLRRSVRCADVPPVAYWPCEDGESAQQVASALPGGPSMTVSGPAVFGFSPTVPVLDFLAKTGSLPLVSLAAGASLQATWTPSLVTAEWVATICAEFYAPDVPVISEMRIVEWYTPGGTHNRWALVAPVAGGYKVRAYNDPAGTSTDVISAPTAFQTLLSLTIEARQNGGNADLELFVNDVSIGTGSIASTMAAPDGVLANPDKTNTTGSSTPYGIKFTVGHIRFGDDVDVFDLPRYTVPETGTLVKSSLAWYQEPAHRRAERLNDEDDVPFFIVGSVPAAGCELLNAQQPGTFTSLLEAAVESESGGLLYERYFGYYYLPRYVRYGKAVDLTIDLSTYCYSAGTDPADVLRPQLQARGANYWTISRRNGSSASFAADAAYRKRRGTIHESRDLDVLTDAVLPQHAGWRTHLNVDGGPNFPEIRLDLAANPALITAWLGCDIGSRVQRTNPPALAAVATLDQVIDGYTEEISPTSWKVVAAGSPAAVWTVGEWDSSTSRWDSATATLAEDLTTTETLWDITAAKLGDCFSITSLPYDVIVGGERCTVTAAGLRSGSGPYTQTITCTRSVNGVVKTHSTGERIYIADAGRWAL